MTWKATDRDRDRLTVTLLARRRGAWRTITTGPARHRARMNVASLGRGKKLQLRLVVSDGFNTTVKAKALRVR